MNCTFWTESFASSDPNGLWLKNDPAALASCVLRSRFWESLWLQICSKWKLKVVSLFASCCWVGRLPTCFTCLFVHFTCLLVCLYNACPTRWFAVYSLIRFCFDSHICFRLHSLTCLWARYLVRLSMWGLNILAGKSYSM